MDPTQWNNIGSSFGRFPSTGTVSAPASARFDILEQAAVQAAGLSSSALGISPPLPAHSGLTAQRLPCLSHVSAVNYGHNLSSSLLEPMASLGPSLSQSPYKTVAVGQPAFSLDSPGRAHAVDQLSRYSTVSAAPSLLSLEKEALSSTFPYSATTSSVTAASEPTKNWELANFIPHLASQFGALASNQFPDLGATGTNRPEPPPAHSRNTSNPSARPSTIQRNPNPYQTKPEFQLPKASSFSLDTYQSRRESPTKPGPPLQPPVAHQHSRVTDHSSTGRNYSNSREIQQVMTTGYSVRERQNYMESPGGNQQGFHDSPQNSPLQRHSLPNSPLDVPQQNSHVAQAQTLRQSAYSYPASSGTTTFSSHPTAMDMMYDPVSPVNPNMDSQTIDRPQQSYSTSISLQDLADISSNREKIPLEATGHGPTVLQSSPSHMLQISHSGVVEVSPVQQLQHRRQVDSPPVQPPSSVNISSSQMNVEPASVTCTHTNKPAAPISAIRAIPDSTTKPKKTRVRRKKKEQQMAPRPAEEPPSAGYTTIDASSSQDSNSVKHTTFQSTQPMIQHYNTSTPVMSATEVSRQASAHTSYSNFEPLCPQRCYSAQQEQQQASQKQQQHGLTVPAMVEPRDAASESVFLTNTYGNTFVNPNDMLGGQVVSSGQQLGGQYVSSINSGMSATDYHRQDTPTKHKTKTKGETRSAIASSDLDDEFGHLKQAAVDKTPPSPASLSRTGLVKHYQQENNSGGVSEDSFKTTSPWSSPGKPSDTGHTNRFSQLSGNHCSQQSNSQAASTLQSSPLPTTTSLKGNKTGAGFMDSFLSFLQGNKGETLSSVTNSTVTKRPALPKYIPDPRPRRVEQPSIEKKRVVLGSRSIDTFSDDDDDDDSGSCTSVKRSIQKAPLRLADASEAEKRPPIKMVLPIPQSLKSNLVQRPRQKVTPKRHRIKGKDAARKRPRISSDDDEFKIDKDANYIDPDKESERSSAAQKRPREPSSRKAKLKIEERRKKKQQRTKKARYEDDDFASSNSDVAYVELSSDESTRDYDSDKDPAWMPFAQDFVANSDEEGKQKRKGKRSRIASGPFGRSTKPAISSVSSSHADKDESSFGTPTDLATEPDQEFPHEFKRGDFIIERKDMLCADEKYPIWKIDAGRLLQKFEPVMSEGVWCHRSLSTYSSWSDDIQEHYKGILVKEIQRGRSEEVVQVLERYRPKPLPDRDGGSALNDENMVTSSEPEQPPTLAKTSTSDAAHDEEDPLLLAFNVYVQILISQVLEPGFLSAIKTENDQYYTKPLEKIESLVREKISEVCASAEWNESFKETVEKFPELTVADQPDVQTSCQACIQSTEVAVKVAHFSGDAYNLSTLEPVGPQDPRDYLICSWAAQHLSTYHSLHHLNTVLYKQCLLKVEALKAKAVGGDISQILDQCLQNRSWVQELFQFVQRLLQWTAERS